MIPYLGSSKLEHFRPDPFSFIKELKKSRSLFPVIDLSIGAPNRPTPSWILESLKNSIEVTRYHTYPPQEGSPELRRAISDWYKTRFDVDLDPEKNVLVTIGTKEALFNSIQAMINQGDSVLVPDPGYPTYFDASYFAGAKVLTYNPTSSEDILINQIEQTVKSYNVKILIINFPSNPTGSIVSLSFYDALSELSHKYSFLVFSDIAYIDIVFDGLRCHSYLQANPSLTNSVEFFSFSKTYNMAGWRVGAMVGDERVISLVKLYKSKVDSGVFYPIQLAAVSALKETPDSYYKDLKEEYQRRRDKLTEYLITAGLSFLLPKGAMYVWVKVPKGTDCWNYVRDLHNYAGIVTVPGIAYGWSGTDHVRIGLVQEIDVLSEAGRRICEYHLNYRRLSQ